MKNLKIVKSETTDAGLYKEPPLYMILCLV